MPAPLYDFLNVSGLQNLRVAFNTEMAGALQSHDQERGCSKDQALREVNMLGCRIAGASKEVHIPCIPFLTNVVFTRQFHFPKTGPSFPLLVVNV